MTHAMMGAALSLSFGLALILINPVVAALLQHSGTGALAIVI